MTPVEALREAWAQWSTEPSFPWTSDRHGYCIDGTRVGIEVLRALGVKAKPCSVHMRLFALTRPGRYIDLGYDNGSGPSESNDYKFGGWNGHLIIEGDGWFLDLSSMTLNRDDEYGVVKIDRPFLLIGTLDGDEWGHVGIGNMVTIDVQRAPQNNGWRRARGWTKTPDGGHKDVVAEALARTQALLSQQDEPDDPCAQGTEPVE